MSNENDIHEGEAELTLDTTPTDVRDGTDEGTPESSDPENKEGDVADEMKPIPLFTGGGQCDTTGWFKAQIASPTVPFDRTTSVAHAATNSRFRHVMDNIEDRHLAEDVNNYRWAEALNAAGSNTLDSLATESRIREAGSNWQQSLEYRGNQITARSPNMSNPTGRAQGTAAVLKVQSMLGIGSVIYVPLPHSCMYLALKTPSLGDILDLEHSLVSSKVILGRLTLGASFTADEASKVENCIRAVLRHVYESTITDTSVDGLMEVIAVTDYPIILNAMAQNLYPKGYDYYQPCMADPRTCVHVTEGRIDLSKTVFYDRSRFTEAQLKTLALPKGKLTIDEVRKLQGQFTDAIETKYKINDILSVSFKVPTLEQFTSSSAQWFQNLTNSIDDSLELSTTERNSYLHRASRLNELCKYHHWVSRISWTTTTDDLEDGNEGFIDAPEDIFNTLESIAATEDETEAFIKAIEKFMADSTVALIGLPDFDCPNCEQAVLPADNVTGIIPLRMINLFMELITRKLVKAETKKQAY